MCTRSAEQMGCINQPLCTPLLQFSSRFPGYNFLVTSRLDSSGQDKPQIRSASAITVWGDHVHLLGNMCVTIMLISKFRVLCIVCITGLSSLCIMLYVHACPGMTFLIAIVIYMSCNFPFVSHLFCPRTHLHCLYIYYCFSVSFFAFFSPVTRTT